MLVLSRKEGDSIVIDGGIEITITEIQGSRVRIAIKAPKQVGITRGELLTGPLVEACRTPAGERPTRSSAVIDRTTVETC